MRPESPAEKARRYKRGDRVGIYQVEDPRGFADVLPTARIVEGNPNAGLLVILTNPYKQGASEEGAS